MKFETLVACVAAGSVASFSLADELLWTGGGDGTSFGDAANWDGEPTGGSLDVNALADDFVIGDPSACIGCPGGVSQLSWADPNVGSLTIHGGSLGGATGLRYTTLIMDGGEMTRQFLLEVNVTLAGDGQLILNGGGNPVNLSTISFESSDASVHFLNETTAEVTAEHLGSCSFFGLPAIEGVTYTLESDGGNGSFLSAVEGKYEPAVLEWTGDGDGASFGDIANWSGTPTGGTIDLGLLLDTFVIGEGDDVGGVGVADMDFAGQGSLEMTGGILLHSGDGLAGLGGGSAVVTGGELQRQFLAGTQVAMSGSGTIALNGGADPLPFGTTVDMSGEDCAMIFLNELVEDFALEHLTKITVDGSPAEIGVNLSVAIYMEVGCIISPIDNAGPGCPADLNDDNIVDGADMGLLIAAWGACTK